MSEELSGPGPDDAAAAGDPGLAERLIRDEFSEDASAHRTWFHREGKETAAAAGVSTHGDTPDPETGGPDLAHQEEVAPDAPTTAEVPAAASELPADQTIAVSATAIHEAFVEPTRPPRSRSHRAGMLAGLAVVGALLAVLVVLAPGGSPPRLPAQSVHDVSPIAASGPKTAAATTPTTAAPSTTTSAPATTPATQQHQSETISTIITYSYVPGSTPAPAPTTAPPAVTTTAPPQTTTTTAPPPTTTTTTTCVILGLIRC